MRAEKDAFASGGRAIASLGSLTNVRHHCLLDREPRIAGADKVNGANGMDKANGAAGRQTGRMRRKEPYMPH